jgi:hypothetical protein
MDDLSEDFERLDDAWAGPIEVLITLAEKYFPILNGLEPAPRGVRD